MYFAAPSSTPQANIMVHLSKMRENHLEYSSELARYSNEVTTTYKETPRTDAENKSLTDLALRGLHLLSDWTCVVTELTSWKLLHPTDHHQNNDCPSEVGQIFTIFDPYPPTVGSCYYYPSANLANF